MSGWARYRAVLQGTGAAFPLTVSLVGRLSLGMMPLAVLLDVRAHGGSYRDGGLVVAASGVGLSLIAPRWARLADRHGPVRALRLTAVLHPLAGVAFLAALRLLRSGAGHPSLLWLAVPTAVLGATTPPLGAVMRALWEATSVPAEQRATGFALESALVEIGFLAGPVVTAALVVLSGPSGAVTAAVLVGTAGAAVLSASRLVRRVGGHGQPRRGPGPLAEPAVRSLLLVALLVGVGFGVTDVAVPAFVEAHHARPAAAGPLLALWSLGSLLGGLAFGALRPSRSSRPLVWCAAAQAVVTCLLAAAPGRLALGAGLLGYGLTIAPLFTTVTVQLSRVAPPGTVTETFAWVSSLTFAGGAVGNAVSGAVISGHGPRAGLALVGAASAAAAVAAVRSRRRLDGAPGSGLPSAEAAEPAVATR